jgi:hypothetical protein
MVREPYSNGIWLRWIDNSIYWLDVCFLRQVLGEYYYYVLFRHFFVELYRGRGTPFTGLVIPV